MSKRVELDFSEKGYDQLNAIRKRLDWEDASDVDLVRTALRLLDHITLPGAEVICGANIITFWEKPNVEPKILLKWRQTPQQ